MYGASVLWLANPTIATFLGFSGGFVSSVGCPLTFFTNPPLCGYYAKTQNAQVIVRGLRVFSDFEFEFRMALTNQRLAPGIEMVNLMTREEHTFLSSTTVKEVASLDGDITSMVPPNVRKELLARFVKPDDLAGD